MKKLLLFISFLFIQTFLFSQGTESFDNHTASGASYGEGTYTGDNGSTWTYDGARNPGATDQITGKSIGFGRTSHGTRLVSSTSGANGVDEITFSIRSYFTGGNASNRTMEVFVDGESKGSFTLAAMGTVETHTITGINKTGDVEIRFQSTGDRQIVLDDVSWLPAPMPVEMTSFNARNVDNSVHLDWATASELNNSHFELEVSQDGRQFEYVVKVQGNGTTLNAQSYEYIHQNPANGVSYYRLKQVDFDGAFEYSEVRSVRVEGENNIRITPSAAISQIEVEVNTLIANNTSIRIIDMMGRNVLSTTFDGDSNSKVIDVVDLSKGHYIVHVQAGAEVMTQRFVKITE